MKLINFLKQNKLISLIILTLLSIIVIGIIGKQIITNRINQWPTSVNKITQTKEQLSLDYLKKKQQDIISGKNALTKNLKSLDSLSFNNIETTFNKDLFSDFSFAVYSNNAIVFWNENYEQQIKKEDTLNFNFGETFFLKVGIDTYLLVKDTISIGEQKANFVLAKIVEKDYELNPTFFDQISLTKSLSQFSEIDCKINYSSKETKNKDGRKHSFYIKNNNDKIIASITFVKPTRENSVKELEDKLFVTQSLLALFAYFLFGFTFYAGLKKYKSSLLKFTFISFYFIALRYLLILIKFPRTLFSSELLNEKIYYSKFGFGLADSPLELLVTLLVFSFLLYFASSFSIQFYKSSNTKIKSKIYFGVVFIIVLAVYLVSLRAFGASIRGFVFDTSLRYFQNPALNLTPPYILMHLNVLLLGLISILGSSALIFILAKYYKECFQKSSHMVFIITLLFFIVGIITFHVLQHQPQNTIPIKILHAFLVFGIVYGITTFNYQKLTKAIIVYLAASLISIISLLFYNTELEKESLKTTANVIARVNDDFYKSIIRETLLDEFSRKKAMEAFENKNSNFNSYAFMIWSKSLLQRESVNSSVNFIDLNGNLLGGFGSIYPANTIDKIIRENEVIEEIQLFEENLEVNTQKLLRGIFPIKDEYAFLGYLDVSILSDQNEFGFSTHPEFISSGMLNEKAILKLDKLVILDYRNRDLKIVYGEMIPSTELNETILNAQLTAKNDAWLDTDINETEYIIYIKRIKNDNDRLIAVALRDKELSIGLFDFFKIFFTHALLLMIIAIVYFLFYFKKKQVYNFDLRTQLLLAFLIISLIPLVLIAFYFRQVTETKNNDAIYYKLGKRAFSIESYLLNHLPQNGSDKINGYRNASNDLNVNFSVYSENVLEYSTDDLLYDVGLIPKLMNPIAYNKLVLNRAQEVLLKEYINKYDYNSFYYKSNSFDRPIIIKVDDAFNKILLPLSGSEVDVFLFGNYSLAAILIILLSAFLANKISSPIRKLTQATKSVAAGDLSLDIRTNASGEIKELVSGFQYMIKELKLNQTMLAEIEREEAWKEMAKQVAHEIKNPLTPMKLSVQQLITAYDDKSEKFDGFFRKVTLTILNQIETLKNIATEFSNFARMPKLKVERLNCCEVIHQSINLFTDENIKIEFFHSSEECYISGDSEQLRRTFINLIRNSIQANATKIEFELNEMENGFNLLITDNGEGIEVENIEQIFEPNFTTKAEGMGLGLSMVKRYLRSTGADISIKSTSNKGTSFEIIFPN